MSGMSDLSALPAVLVICVTVCCLALLAWAFN
jgi:hypothetical protein